MKKLMKGLLTLCLFASVFLGVKEAKAYNTLEDIQESGLLVVATNAEYPPFEWVSVEGGKEELVGIDIEIAKHIAEELGVELRIDNMAFTAVIDAVKQDKADIALSSLTYTDERAQQVDFSDIYYESGSQFIVPIDQKDKYTSLEDFAKVRIGVGFGSVQESLAREKFPDAEIISAQKNGDVIQGLLTDRTDVVLMDSIAADEYVNKNKDRLVKIEDLQVEDEVTGMSVVAAKGNTELLEAINDIIAEMKESGQIDEIVERNYSLSQQ